MDASGWAGAIWLALSLAVITLGLPALLLARRRALAAAEVARARAQSRPLTPAETRALGAWHRRSILLFVVTLSAYLLVEAGALILTARGAVEEAVATPVVLLALVAALAGGGYHLVATCPVCGFRIALQSALGAPSRCERCHSSLRAATK